ncbi:MAG: PilZ domain-containing protein [Myxococcota bacterium]
MDLRTVASGVWTALSADRLTFAFTLTMLAVFLMALPYHVLRASTGTISFARSAPKMLVSVGVLGTLAALFTTLLAFDTSARDASLPSLVEGLRASAATGLLGVTLALTHRLFEKLVPPLRSGIPLPEVARPTGEATTADLATTVLDELQTLRVTLENQIEEARSESQKALEGLAAVLHESASQLDETRVDETRADETQVDETPELPPAADLPAGSLPARRFQIRIPVDYDSAGQCGRGTLVDISSSGALIEEADIPLSAGAFVEICYKLEGDEQPTLLGGKVARETDSGFGVEFVERRNG